jgi:putative tryptophan/tyrosine transport system substrate-binding protein
MRRREFIVLLGGAVTASTILWPLTVRAQQPERMRRVALFMNRTADDPASPINAAAFVQELQRLGWTEGHNLRIDWRWAGSDIGHYRAYAAELLALAPDVIVTGGGSITGTVQQATRTVPIVFSGVIDPVGGGFVASLARPGGNATGFGSPDYSISGKWLALLKEIAPRVTQAAVLRNATIAGGGQFGALQAVAPSLRVDLTPFDARDTGDIERAITTFGREPNGGLIVTGSAAATTYRDLIVMLAARHRLPAVYPGRSFTDAGGLISYGQDASDVPLRHAASYVERILRGEKTANLPVQAPTKFELIINLKTAKALGLDVPPKLLAIADKVIE